MSSLKKHTPTSAERKDKLTQASGLQLVHWLVIFLSVLLTLAAWSFSKDQVHQKIEAKFNREALQLVERIRDRMTLYENALWAGVALIDSNQSTMTYPKWLSYSNSLKIDQSYPGINGIGVIYNIQSDQLASYLSKERLSRPNYKIHPKHTESEYWPITYIEPSASNQQAVGLDMAFETNRYTGVKKARDTGKAQLTGPITLVQDAQHTPGFVLYAPFYKNGAHPTSVDERRKSILGATYAPFIMYKLMQGTLALENRHVDIKITDSGELLFEDDKNRAEYDHQPLYKKAISVEFYGRVWDFEMQSDQRFREESSSSQPTFILIGGAIIDLLILTLFIFLARANREASLYAEQTTLELKRKTKHLERSNQRIAIAARAGGVGIWELNLVNQSLVWDEKMNSLYGLAPVSSEKQIEAWQKAIHQEDLAKATESFQHAIKTATEFDSEFRITTPSGEVRWIKVNAEVIKGATGRSELMIGTNIDITEKELYAKELEKARSKAEFMSKSKSEFLANMSHEIRTPINGVLGMLRLLGQTELKEQQSSYLSYAKASADSLLRLINDILDNSKIEAGKLTFESVEFNLRELIEDISKLMALMASEKNIELVLDTTQVDSSIVKGDPGRLRQILTNLLSNAIKFTPQGEIVIKAELSRTTGNELLFRCAITDTGIGIKHDQLHKLFGVFTQGDESTTRKYGGTGLGLSISRELSRLMGGDISAQSEYGVGSTFTVEVKLEFSGVSTPLLPSSDLSTLKVLVVDDNAASGRVLHGQLSMYGVTARVAHNADEAMDILNSSVIDSMETSFDFALIDMQMPEADGESLAKTIRSNDRFNRMQLFAMISMCSSADEAYLSSIGFQTYFTKPLVTKSLLQVLSLVVDDGKTFEQDRSLPVDDSINTQFSGHVLLVEDVLTNQIIAKTMLTRMGLTVDLADDGLQAIKQWQQNSYGIIFMDCRMPNMDGYEATRNIRSKEDIRRTPIIALTANATDEDRKQCYETGMDAVVTKPFKPSDLQTVLSKWLKTDTAEDALTSLAADQLETSSVAAIDLKIIKENKALLGEEFTVFVNSIFKDIDSILEKLSGWTDPLDIEGLALLPHSLKSISSYIGAAELNTLAHACETAAREGKVEQALSYVNDMKKAYANVITEMAKLGFNG